MVNRLAHTELQELNPLKSLVLNLCLLWTLFKEMIFCECR